MAFCLGTFLKTVKRYEVDQTISNFAFVNEFLDNVLAACTAGGCYRTANLDKTTVSKILACKYNVSLVFKQCLENRQFHENLIDCLNDYSNKHLQHGCFKELSSEILKLCNRADKSQVIVFDKLNKCFSETIKVKQNTSDDALTLSKFMALAIIEAFQLPNIIDTDCIIGQCGNSKLCLCAGDIFKFGFNRHSKGTNIVVIPVNTRFDLHVSRTFEGQVKQLVSSQTLHGMWVERMARRSTSKKFVDSSYVFNDENKLKQRIIADLTVRNYKADNNGEYPIGTVALIEVENTIFYLLAASKFDENNNAFASKVEIEEALNSLVKFYNQNGQGQNMYLPLIGTGMSRAGFSNQESFDLICKTFNPANNSFVGKVTVVVLHEVYENLKL